MTHDQKASEEKGKKLHDEREALKKKARDIRAKAGAHLDPDDPGGDQIPRPGRDDPRYGQPSTPPGQSDVPAGGSTGSAMGGSAHRKKQQAG